MPCEQGEPSRKHETKRSHKRKHYVTDRVKTCPVEVPKLWSPCTHTITVYPQNQKSTLAMVKLIYLTSTIIFALSWSVTSGLLKGSSSTKPSDKTRARRLMMEKQGKSPDQVLSCENDTNIKVIGSNDCNIEMSSANGDDDSLVILQEDMFCTLGSPVVSAIPITASRITLDCKGHKIINRGESGKGISIRQGNNIIVRNCDISLFEQGIEMKSSQNVVLQNVVSHDNIRNGLMVTDSMTDVTVLNSKFDNNGFSGFFFRSGQVLSDLALSAVTANNNGKFGFAFNFPVRGKLLSVEVNENGRSGIETSSESTDLVIQDSKFCRNGGGGSVDIGVLEGTVVHQATTCTIDQDRGICDCQCPV